MHDSKLFTGKHLFLACFASALTLTASSSFGAPTPAPTYSPAMSSQCDAGRCRRVAGDWDTCSRDSDCSYLTCRNNVCTIVPYDSIFPDPNVRNRDGYNMDACAGKQAGASCLKTHKACRKPPTGGSGYICSVMDGEGTDTCKDNISCNEQEYQCKTNTSNTATSVCVLGDKSDPNVPKQDKCSPIASVGESNSCNRLACVYSQCKVVSGSPPNEAPCLGRTVGNRCATPTPTPK